MSKTRVFVSINGDYKTPPAIVVVKEGMSFEDFLAKAALKLKMEDKKFTRCFYITNAAELDDPDDLMPDDKLFVSEGEDFKEEEKDGVLSGGLTALAGGASSLYTGITGFAKARMSEDMKKKFEDAEATVNRTLDPMVQKAKKASAPALDWADKRLGKAGDAISEKKKEFLASDTAKFLKEKVVDPVNVKFAKPAAAKAKVLFGLASEELKKIGDKSKEKIVPFKEYMESVKTKMGKEWDEKLAPAVKSMYEQAKEKGKGTAESLKVQQEKLQKIWIEKTLPVLRENMEKVKVTLQGNKDEGGEIEVELKEP